MQGFAPMTCVALHAVVTLLELASDLSSTHPPAVMMGLLMVHLSHATAQEASL